MAWMLVVLAGAIEVVFALALKDSDGFTRLWPAVLCIVSGAASVALLAIALRSLPVGTGYAVWVGLGAAGVALAGILLHGDSASPLRLAFIGLIVLGVAGLRVIEG